MHYKIREITETEYPLLEDFLYEAIYIPKGTAAPPRSIIKRPELQVYIDGFGTHPGDAGFITEIGGEMAGAVWTRIMDDYGHIDNDTPSFAISLYEPYRSMGIGTAMMRKMLERLKQQGYKRASLAVQKDNYALKLYQKVGFEIVDENPKEFIMVCSL